MLIIIIILDVSKIESNKIILEEIEFDILNSLRALSKPFQFTNTKNNIGDPAYFYMKHCSRNLIKDHEILRESLILPNGQCKSPERCFILDVPETIGCNVIGDEGSFFYDFIQF